MSDTIRRNIFENESGVNQYTLSHADQSDIIKDMKRSGSFQASLEEFGNTIAHGLQGIEILFPDADGGNVTSAPEFIKRDTEWVSTVMNGTKKSRMTRLRSMWADITADEARAKGFFGKSTNAAGESNKEMLDANGKPYRDAYGNMVRKDGTRVYKTEEVFGFLKRTTQPTTVYKKQRFDRNDLIDITGFDVVSWIKSEMKMMLEEEIARAILVGDGRDTSDDDKIDESCIRPIYKDNDFFNVKALVEVTDSDDIDTRCEGVVRAAIKARKYYKGSGNPTLFTTEDWLTDLLLMKDGMGRDLYDSETKLATKMRVKNIVTCPVLEDVYRTGQITYTDSSGTEVTANFRKDLVGIIVNLNDYSVGTDKGGEVNMFDDFDIDYNQQKYLIETRLSGSLMKPYGAITIEMANLSHPIVG